MNPDRIKPEAIRRENLAQTCLAKMDLGRESKDRRRQRNRQPVPKMQLQPIFTNELWLKFLCTIHTLSSFSWPLSSVGNKRTYGDLLVTVLSL